MDSSVMGPDLYPYGGEVDSPGRIENLPDTGTAGSGLPPCGTDVLRCLQRGSMDFPTPSLSSPFPSDRRPSKVSTTCCKMVSSAQIPFEIYGYERQNALDPCVEAIVWVSRHPRPCWGRLLHHRPVKRVDGTSMTPSRKPWVWRSMTPPPGRLCWACVWLPRWLSRPLFLQKR